MDTKRTNRNKKLLQRASRNTVKRNDVKWEITGSNNCVLRADWGHISYNPNTGMAHFLAGELTNLLNALRPYYPVVDGEETALYDGEVWRILTGDFRKDYEKVFPNKEKCLEVYKSNIKHRNNYSTD